MPGKCPKCVVDAVVVVEPTYDAVCAAAVNKLRLKLRDPVSRLELTLRKGVAGYPAGFVLPRERDLSAYLANDAVLAVKVLPAAPVKPRSSHAPEPPSHCGDHDPSALACGALGGAPPVSKGVDDAPSSLMGRGPRVSASTGPRHGGAAVLSMQEGE